MALRMRNERATATSFAFLHRAGPARCLALVTHTFKVRKFSQRMNDGRAVLVVMTAARISATPANHFEGSAVKQYRP